MLKATLMGLSVAVSIAAASAADPAEQAWNSLVDKKVAKQSAFSYVKNDPKLPNVLIYGDSISIGYTPEVRKLLAGKANVYRIHANGGDTGRVIELMEKMHKPMAEHWTFTWDVIHFNAGLHDLKYLNEKKALDLTNGKQVRSPEAYGEKLKEVFGYFKKIAPNATIIFATTTPVPENSKGRKAGDAVIFNESALAVLKNYPEIVVNDLYALTKPNQKQWWASPGDVHYKARGTQAQAKQVATVIEEALKKEE